ncbi:M56 family metallopeptidase [Flammeovirga sp. EKP202]|uniref:M56 family metallopeptidase n=1 Tax=Flammeovirga sp. EKP202 TaxID=2770592 RepID=UPI00165F13D4|nr:M56 family metallopeptidase [Flammeovirga sp. EKP202]MBD0400956.1 M56 family metallopeptidase [Flammeovirga sp. EKP202]
MISYLLISSIGLVVLVLFYFVFHKNETFFQQNRLTLLIGILVSITFPMFDSILSNYQQTIITEVVPTLYLPELVIGGGTIEERSFSEISTSNLVLMIYSLVFFILLTRFIISNFKLLKFIRFHQRVNFKGSTLIYTDGKYPTFAYLKYIFWDNTTKLTTKEQDMIFQHERTHIKELHSLDIFLMEILKITFWFHPAIYLIDAALRTQHEYLADQKANQMTNDASYSQLMIQSLFEDISLNMGHGFQFSTVKSRIKMLKKERTNQWKRVSSLFTFSILVSSIIFLQACVKDEINAVDPRLAEVTSETLYGYELEDKIYWDTNSNSSLKDLVLPYEISQVRVITGNQLPQIFSDNVTGVIIVEVKNEVDLGKRFNINDMPSTSASLFKMDQKAETIADKTKMDLKGVKIGDDNEIYEVVQNPAGYPGGMEAFYKVVGNNMKYPKEAIEKRIEGKVFLQFVINKEGNGEDFKIVRGVDPLLDQEALRVAQLLTKEWTPANNKGEIVKQRLVLPINFKL